MKEVQRIVMLGLVALLVVAPVAMAQTTVSPNTNVTPNANVGTGNQSGSASPPTGSTDSTNTGGQASPSAPASKDDCKDGRWQKYGFRNQGQCVSSFGGMKDR